MLLLRTPLQAWIARSVLCAEQVDIFDLVYFTEDDSAEDRAYFRQLATRANAAQYVFVPRKKFSLATQAEFRKRTYRWFKSQAYDLVLLASIDAYIPAAIAARQAGTLITFDDGTANINRTSSYFQVSSGLRELLYRRYFGAPSIVSLRDKSVRHYTLHPELPNIVERPRLRAVRGWLKNDSARACRGCKTYFLGQPFDDVLTRKQRFRLESYLRHLSIDFYVKHPRENKVLRIGVPLLQKGGMIAEDAIVKDAGEYGINLIGGFSSALFNLAAVAQRRTMLVFGNSAQTRAQVQLAKQVGCEVKEI